MASIESARLAHLGRLVSLHTARMDELRDTWKLSVHHLLCDLRTWEEQEL